MTVPLTIICASNDDETLEENLLESPCIADGKVECIIQKGFSNVPLAYNQAMGQASNDLIAFLHHDVRLPEGWESKVLEQIEKVATIDPNWAIAGCAGAVLRGQDKFWLGNIFDRASQFGNDEPLPALVDTLDELSLICRKADALFDEAMPSHHLFGAELCLRHRKKGRKCYAINAYLHHNSFQDRYYLDATFAISCGYIYANYRDLMPIATTCVTIHQRDGVVVFSV